MHETIPLQLHGVLSEGAKDYAERDCATPVSGELSVQALL